MSHIPFPRNHPNFPGVDNQLNAVLNQIRAAVAGSASQALWVSCRLNRTGATVPSPVFVGWIEDPAARNLRTTNHHQHAPADTRINDTHVSSLYKKCFAVRPGEVVKRDWSADKADPTSQELGKIYYGETHRRSMPIVLGNQYVGTLNVAFKGDPTAKDPEIKQVLEDWAQKPTSALITHIQHQCEVSKLPCP
ncbi:MAG: hypothetical protein HYV04_20930 [Deltaproteobacteria bacterium]|nr:hypothetical protein [Deltaproteobacteria bacterium]